MVPDVAGQHERSTPDVSFTELLERRQEYFSLKPHLPGKTLEVLRAEKERPLATIKTLERLQAEKAKSWDVLKELSKEQGPAEGFVELLMDDIARIEKQWDLV